MGASESLNTYGFRVYKLYEESPLIKAGLKELEDFIVPPEGINDTNFKEFLNKFLNKNIELTIYNMPSRSFYKISVIPNLSWGSGSKGSLGGLISYENYSTAHLNLLKILKVNEGSIAQKVGILAEDDYIIAIKPESENFISLNTKTNDPLSLFSNIVKSYSNKFISLYIYNTTLGAKVLHLNLTGKETLGCDVGFSNENKNYFVDTSNKVYCISK